MEVNEDTLNTNPEATDTPEPSQTPETDTPEPTNDTDSFEIDDDEETPPSPDAPKDDTVQEDGAKDETDEPKPDTDKPKDPKQEAREGYQKRQQNRLDQRAAEVAREQQEYIASLNPDDTDYQLNVLTAKEKVREANELVREVRANQATLRNDSLAAVKIPMFDPSNKENFVEGAYERAEEEFIRNYVEPFVAVDPNDPENIEITGAFDPKTGKPVSFYQFMQNKAEEYSQIVQAGRSQGESIQRQMSNASDDPGAGGVHKDPKDDPEFEGW